MKKGVKVALIFCLVAVASAEAASGTGTTTYFQGLWTVLGKVLGDTYIGYLAAGAGIGVGAQRWWENLPTIQVIKPIILGASFGSITALSQALAGATF